MVNIIGLGLPMTTSTCGVWISSAASATAASEMRTTTGFVRLWLSQHLIFNQIIKYEVILLLFSWINVCKFTLNLFFENEFFLYYNSSC